MRILAFDIGATGLKAAVIDARGKFITDRVRVPTPHPCPPKVLLSELKALAAPLGRFDRITMRT